MADNRHRVIVGRGSAAIVFQHSEDESEGSSFDFHMRMMSDDDEELTYAQQVGYLAAFILTQEDLMQVAQARFEKKMRESSTSDGDN